MSAWGPVGVLAVEFALLSLVAIGGVGPVLPEMHRLTVEVHRWMTAAEFAELFALAQAAPGPNVLVVSLIGYRVAGLTGGVVALIAMCGPSAVLAYGVARVWERHRDSTWRRLVEASLAPITVGLVLATGYLLARGAGGGATHVLTALAALIALLTRLHPLWLLLGAAVLGLAGVV